MENERRKSFNTRADGFCIPIGNYFIDVGIGGVHHCETHFSLCGHETTWESNDCKIMILDKERNEITQEIITEMNDTELFPNCDDVMGYVTEEQFQRVIKFLLTKSEGGRQENYN